MSDQKLYSQAFQALDQQDQNTILQVFAKTEDSLTEGKGKVSQKNKLIEEGKKNQSKAILQDLIESSAWKNFRAKRKELASLLIESTTNDIQTAEQEVEKLETALAKAKHHVKIKTNNLNSLKTKLLGSSNYTLTDAHPNIKEAIESGEIKNYIKQSDGSYTLGDQKLPEQDAHKLMGAESLYAITEECPYWRGEPKKTTTIFARKNNKGVDGIQRAFELQGITQENYTDSKLLTEKGLKPLFEKYNNKKYEYLFNQPDWLKLDSNAKQQLQQLVMEINPPKAGYQSSGGVRGGFATNSYLWLPLFIVGRQVCLGSNGSVASFGYWDESDALLVCTFTN